MPASNIDFLDALAANQKTNRDKLHELETGDVSISHEALAALGRTARGLLAEAVGAGNSQAMTLSDIVRLFVSKLYWNESGGELIMCAQLDGRTLCMPIPPEHWNVIITGQIQ
jgi:hypothetical protein